MNLKTIRKLNGKTQIEVARDLGIMQNTYSNYEIGKTQPDFEVLVKLADYFHTTVDAILGHDVPYLLDKSVLTPKQRRLVELVCHVDDNTCELAEAYITGRVEGKKKKNLQRKSFSLHFFAREIEY